MAETTFLSAGTSTKLMMIAKVQDLFGFQIPSPVLVVKDWSPDQLKRPQELFTSEHSRRVVHITVLLLHTLCCTSLDASYHAALGPVPRSTRGLAFYNILLVL